MFNIPTANDYSPGQLRSTQSYIFKTEEVLGEGATSKVFLGRNKKNGEKVAVKVFNHASFDRPSAVQDREFDVLLKIQHENIVRLLAIEKDQISKQRIIIMELCSCSVLNMLDKPDYIYGFPERDFLDILKDTTAGMRYLQQQGIVHRDIKPGNIMRTLSSNRKATYKLADFGAARQLQEDENFTSLYGTEEYLHPNVFERALLKKPLLKPFNAKVDLWSLGVTIFHIATGLLPFRPFGGRKNRSTMHKLTTQKETGVISAVQKESEDGPIEYGTELPKHCRLSAGLRLLITEILVGLLESDTDKMWSFETYFQMVQSILIKRSFDIHCVASAQMLRVYIDPDVSFAEFQEHVTLQSNIPSDRQILIYDNDHFHPDASVTCASYPVTSVEQPIILIPFKFNGCGTSIPPTAPSMPEVKSNYSLEADYPLSRLCAGVLHFMQCKQNQLLSMILIFNMVSKAVRSITKNQIMQLKLHLADANSKKQCVDNCLKSVEDKAVIMLQFLDSYLVDANGCKGEGESIRFTLIGVQKEISDTRQLIQVATSRQLEASEKMKACEDYKAIMCWENTSGCRPYDRCRETLDVIREDVEAIVRQYRQDRKTKNLGYNEVQIHKMEKMRLREKTTQAVSLLRDHCENNWRESHSQLMEWFGRIAPIQANIRDVDSLLSELINFEYPSIDEIVETKCAIWDTRIDNSRERLSDLMKIAAQKPKKLKPGQVIGRVGQLALDCATDVEPPIIYRPPGIPESLSLQDQSSSEARDLTLHSNMITVPRALKRELEAYEATADRTKEEIERSQELLKAIEKVSLETNSQRFMEELQDMSLGIPDKPDFNFVNHME